ncbi:ABC transporter permease (plasmid) [Pantoea stewartii]|uniref:ABC transporter permease n=1 Tax=Pantoea TaxID=53335 RepID=UPI000541F387|nr:ABC transporter permease [Pantoea stewartii]KHE01230.1 ABC transporter permease [Pantoea stewartii]KHN63525.1 ABC transporter permease [Pantoea stewartii]MEB6536316.1 ABC transporter permease [Pantoea stewartii]QIE99714.1 ABC transporter permease [Pantoea stewartii]
MTYRQKTGLVIILTLLAFAWLMPLFDQNDPLQQDLLQMLTPPSGNAWLGYDHLGRSMLARLSAALRLSLGLAALCVITAMLMGLLAGIASAWYGGWVDRLFGMLADMCLALPGLLLVLLLAAIAPDAPLMLWLGLSLVLWVEFFRVTRATLRPVVMSPAVQSSSLLGFSIVYLFRRHLWPALSPLLLTLTVYAFSNAIMAVSALGFISVGVRPPTPELGLMMTELFPYAWEAPWLLLQPVVVLFILLVGLNLLVNKERKWQAS